MAKITNCKTKTNDILLPSEEGVRRAILVKALLFQIYINKSNEEISVFKFVDSLQLLFKSVVSFAFFNKKEEVVFYSIRSPRYEEDFIKQVEMDGFKSADAIFNTDFYVSVYQITKGKEKKSFRLLKDVGSQTTKDEYKSFMYLWDSIVPNQKPDSHQELGLNEFINEILDKANEPRTIHPIDEEISTKGYGEFFKEREAKVKTVINNIYSGLKGKAIIERNGLKTPALLFFFKPYRYPTKRFDNQYPYPLQIILCKKQIGDITIVLESIKNNNDNLNSDSFYFKINDKTVENSVYSDNKISKMFWDELNTENGIENLIAILEKPFTDARSFVDDVYYSSLSHWVSPFNSTSSFGKDRMGKNSGVDDKLRLAIVYYFFSCVTARSDTETLFVKASPIRVGGCPYLVAACPMAYSTAQRKGLIFDIAYYLESSILSSMATNFRKRIKNQYLNDVSDIFYDAFKAAFIRMKSEAVIIFKILKEINDRYYHLCRIYPYLRIVCELTFFKEEDQASVQELCTITRTFSRCLGGQRYLEIKTNKPNPFFSKMLEKNFNHVDKIKKEIERAFKNVSQYIFDHKDKLEISITGEQQ